MKPQFASLPLGPGSMPASESIEDKAYLDQLDKSAVRSAEKDKVK
jgi:hypothetical protein